MLNCETMKPFLLKSRIKTMLAILLTIFIIILEVLASTRREEKEI